MTIIVRQVNGDNNLGKKAVEEHLTYVKAINKCLDGNLETQRCDSRSVSENYSYFNASTVSSTHHYYRNNERYTIMVVTDVMSEDDEVISRTQLSLKDLRYSVLSHDCIGVLEFIVKDSSVEEGTGIKNIQTLEEHFKVLKEKGLIGMMEYVLGVCGCSLKTTFKGEVNRNNQFQRSTSDPLGEGLTWVSTHPIVLRYEFENFIVDLGIVIPKLNIDDEGKYSYDGNELDKANSMTSDPEAVKPLLNDILEVINQNFN